MRISCGCGDNRSGVANTITFAATTRLARSGNAATFLSTDVKQAAAGLAYTLIPALKLKKEKLIG